MDTAHRTAARLKSARVTWLTRAFALIALTCSSGAGAIAVRLEPEAFTAIVIQVLREKAPPSMNVSAGGPFAVRMEQDGVVMNARLESLHRQCIRQQGICRDAIKAYVDSSLEMFAGPKFKAERSHLRVLVRDTRYVKQLRDIHNARGTGAPVARQYLPDVWMVLALAGESLQWIATSNILETLQLDESSAFEIALRNTRSALIRLSHVAKPLGHSMFSYSVGDYESSRLLMHADWAPLARTYKGDLLVAVPARDMIIFGAIESPADFDRFKQMVKKIATDFSDPAGPQLYRWRASGWELLSLSDEVAASDESTAESGTR